MYERSISKQLLHRLQEPRRFLQVLAGARQTGKTTLVRCVALAEWADGADLVVMGARSGGAFGAALLGSVSGWLLHNVDRPMVVVPHHDGPTGTDAGSD